MLWGGVKVSWREKRFDWWRGWVKMGEVEGAEGAPVKCFRKREEDRLGVIWVRVLLFGAVGVRLWGEGPVKVRRCGMLRRVDWRWTMIQVK